MTKNSGIVFIKEHKTVVSAKLSVSNKKKFNNLSDYERGHLVQDLNVFKKSLESFIQDIQNGEKFI